MLVNHGKTLNIFPRLSRTTKKIQDFPGCGNPVKNVASPFAILRVPGLAMTWGEGSTAVGIGAPALARQSVCSFSRIPAWTGTNWKVWVALLESEKAFGQTFQGDLGRRYEGLKAGRGQILNRKEKGLTRSCRSFCDFYTKQDQVPGQRFHRWNWRQLDRRRRKESRRSWRAFKI